ncbi:tudor domain-containing protein 5 isoform X2 [Halyomorpha halys]|uniref:tudor domain-containing protein 5 isoform X2 n=1 Tax=Halyomorpha halys TaxID=286706 RepID=UPI0006D50BAE|nr:tudor domain-containing protein 5-like isoform X2 [Halyomorpha halys]
MDDDKLKVLKTEVTSILTSSGTPLTVRQFLREYKEVIGRNFPWAQHGFKTPSECLKSMPDILSFKKHEGGEILVPTQNNSSHITKLVQEQKKNVKKGSIRRPRPVQLPRDDLKSEIKPLRQIEIPQQPHTFRGWETQPVPPLMSIPTYQHQQNFAYASHEYSHMSHNLWNIDQMPLVLNTFSTLKTEYTRTKLPLTSKKAPFNEVQDLRQLSITNGYCENGDQRYVKSKTNEISANNLDKPQEELFENKYPVESHNLGEDNHCRVDNFSKTSSFNNFEVGEEEDCPIGDKMKENFRKILKKHKNGLLVSKLASTYLKMFNVGLNCQDYGFPTIKDLVMSCHDVFKIQQKKHAKDWLLFDLNDESDDSTRWIPRQVLENMQELSLAHPNGISSDEILKLYKKMFKIDLDIKKLGFESLTSFLVNCQSIECCTNDDKYVVFPMKWGNKVVEQFEESTTDPFLSVDTYSIFSKKRFKDNVCGYDFQYEKCIMPKEATMKVIVADCNSPDCLWLQTLDNAALLNNLMYEINTFYDEEEEQYMIDEDMIHPGLACCIKFNNKQWHRGLVQKVLEDSQSVTVLYVDYGTTSCIPLEDLRTLHKKFSEPPIYSFKSKMYNVKPINNEVWTEECLEFFYQSIFNEIFVAEIVEIINEVASVILVDTKGSEDHVINFMLVENGFAVYRSEKSEDYYRSGSGVSSSISEKESSPIFKKSRRPHPDYFLKLFPYWFDGVQNWNDINHIFEKASHEFFNESSDDNLAEIFDYFSSTKCTQNDLLELFIKKPKIICDAWNRTFYSLVNVFEKKFMENIQAELLNQLGYQNGNNRSHINHTTSDNTMNSNLKANFEQFEIHSKNSVSHRLADKSESYHSIDQCHSPYQSFPDRHDYYNRNCNNTLKDVHTLSYAIKHNTDPKVIPAKMFNTVIHLIRYNAEIYIIMDELLTKFAKGIPSVLVKHRLSQHQINLAPFIVTPDHQRLYAELRRERIDFKNGPISLIPLSMSSDILLAVEPRNRTVAEVLNELISECYSSHEFWST